MTALEDGRLKIASGLRYAAALVGELQAFQRQVTGAGRDAYGAKARAHDDLVVAVALAMWWMGREYFATLVEGAPGYAALVH